jgi:PII-like signaling protein
MLQAGKAIKVSIYLSDGATHHGVPVYSSILDFLYFRGVAGATVLKGIAGFGADHHMHSSSFVEISDRLPVKIEFIETREKVEAILGKLEELAGTGLIEMQETTVAKPAQISRLRKPAPPAHLKIEGKAQMMRIFLSEEDRWNGKPLHEALVEALRANDIAGVTVYRGILGYGAHRRIHKDKPLFSAHHGSIMLSVIDTEEKLRSFLPLVDRMVQEGLVVFSGVDIVKYAYRPLQADSPGIDGKSSPASERASQPASEASEVQP